MKKKPFTLFVFIMVCIASVMAQNAQIDLPWFPYRDTNHIRTSRAYSIDTVTGERNSLFVQSFHRNGYVADTSCHYVYDKQGRLTEMESYSLYFSVDIPSPKYMLSERYNIDYGTDGTVKKIRYVSYTAHDSTCIVYDLITHKTHPKYGLLEYSFRRTYNKKEIDTVCFIREYDDQGRLIREYKDGEDHYDIYFSSELTYRYDNEGRRIAESGYYYESSDTLDYHYDEHGVLTSITGTAYDLGMEGKLIIKCRPDGTFVEQWQYWFIYDDPDKPDVEYIRYDDRGNAVYIKTSSGITEYEIEYWE